MFVKKKNFLKKKPKRTSIPTTRCMNVYDGRDCKMNCNFFYSNSNFIYQTIHNHHIHHNHHLIL